MYDPTETELSHEELEGIFKECNRKNIPVSIIGGWATFFYVNPTYRRAFGQPYMGSRDIDIFFDPEKAKAFSEIIYQRGFVKNGFTFRYEKIYNRESKKYITQEQAKKERIYNLIYIFLDLFSNKETEELGSWWDLEPLKTISPFHIGKFIVADINTLVALKCTALFARDKADKENKDACDLYALLQYSEKEITPTVLLAKSIEKILDRPDLLYAVAEHVVLDPSKQNIVKVTLKDTLQQIKNKL